MKIEKFYIFPWTFFIQFGFLLQIVNSNEFDEKALFEKRLIQVKIMEEPANFNLQNIANHFAANRRSAMDFDIDYSSLKPTFRPADLAGPEILKQLNGMCFEHINENYKWIACPFQNVTQFENNLKWRPYKGILGIWYEWEIVDGKFNAMLMLNGDDCGAHGKRTTKIRFICDTSPFNETQLAQIEQVSEPSTCNYEIRLKTALVCDNQTMSVYPYMNEALKSEWDMAFSELKANLITQKMYNLLLRNLFERGKFQRAQDDAEKLRVRDEQLSESIKKDSKAIDSLSLSDLRSELAKCKEENRKLKDLLKTSNSTNANASTIYSNTRIAT